MSVLTITGVDATDGAPGSNPHPNRRTWVMACDDVFGRPAEVTVTAYRRPNPGIGVHVPGGEFGFMFPHQVPDMYRVLAEARAWLGLKGGCQCTA